MRAGDQVLHEGTRGTGAKIVDVCPSCKCGGDDTIVNELQENRGGDDKRRCSTLKAKGRNSFITNQNRVGVMAAMQMFCGSVGGVLVVLFLAVLAVQMY